MHSVQIERFEISVNITKKQTGKLYCCCIGCMSKQKLVAGMKRTRLSLNDKIKILNYANENPKKGCRDIANQFQIGKTAAATILRDGKKLRKEYEFFKGDCKTKRTGQFMVINEILYKWYGKCCAAGIYPFGSMLQEEALKLMKA